MGFLPGWFPVASTVGRQIALALGVMGASTAAITGNSLLGARRTAELATSTFDQGLVATNLTRALADDFDRMRSDFSLTRNGSSLNLAVLHKSFQADLAAAVAQMPDAELSKTGGDLRQAEGDWLARTRRFDPKAPSASQDLVDLEAAGSAVDGRIETMVDRVVGIAQGYRDATAAALTGQTATTLGIGLAALAAAAASGVFLARMVRRPLKLATDFANRALATDEPRLPEGGQGEVGDLIRAIGSMHSKARTSLAEQAAAHARTQDIVAEALDGSQAGVVIADGLGTLQIVNARALDFLGIGDKTLSPGTTLDQVRRLVGIGDETRQALLRAPDQAHESRAVTLRDGRHLRVDRHLTASGGFAAHYMDITAMARQREDLVAAKTTFDAALATMSQALCVFDGERRLKLANRRFYALFDVTPAEVAPGMAYEAMLDLSLARGNHPAVAPERLHRHERFVAARRRRTQRIVRLANELTLTITQTPIEGGGWLATYEDVSEQRRAVDRVAHVARHDALTDLPNRATIVARTEQALARAGDEGVAILYLDLDQFKQVNDSLGHAIGDELLKQVAAWLLALTPRGATVARLGGDEFAVLLPKVPARINCAGLAARITDALGRPYTIGSSTIRIGTSIGIAVSPQDGTSAGQLMKNADLALYRAKEEGRGLFRFFEPDMQARLNARVAMENDLRRAVAAEEFYVEYQPLLDLASMEIGAFEALLRWRRGEDDLVSPSTFIPVAEAIGLIDPIGTWVLRRACREASAWPSAVKVAVNVSVVQLRNPAFPGIVEAALAESGLDPGRLELEITESIFMASNAAALEGLKAIKATGVMIAMDDFGTGYSSLSYLRRFSFDKIKIDRAFITDAIDTDGQHLLQTIITLGKSLRMRVTAEGVETPRQLKKLAEMGCDEIQGFLIGAPSGADGVRATIAQHNGSDGVGGMAA